MITIIRCDTLDEFRKVIAGFEDQQMYVVQPAKAPEKRDANGSVLILDDIRKHPETTARQIADRIGKHQSAISATVSALLQTGKVMRNGSGGPLDPYRYCVRADG